jgi:hypothetical protein
MSDKNAERIAALERELAEVKAALPKPEPEPFKPEKPYQRYDPTAGMSMPMSTMLEMHRASGHVMGGVLHDNRAPTGRPGMIPSGQTSVHPSGGPANTMGWRDATPIGPPPGIRHVDAQLDAQDAKDHAELIERDAKFKATQKLTEKP